MTRNRTRTTLLGMGRRRKLTVGNPTKQNLASLRRKATKTRLFRDQIEDKTSEEWKRRNRLTKHYSDAADALADKLYQAKRDKSWTLPGQHLLKKLGY